MPLTKTGEKVMRAMMEQYGAEKGKQVFYASENKGVAGSSKWAKKKKRNSKKTYSHGAVKAAMMMKGMQ